MRFFLFLTLLLCYSSLSAKTFTLASYNVQNLFDLKKSGLEYTDYIPNTKAKWNKKNYKTKILHLSNTIHDLNPDIIALQEIESDYALKDLQYVLLYLESSYPYRAITTCKETTVHTAILSKFPITKQNEIIVNPDDRIRSILDITLDIEGKDFRVFVNHWKSKRGSESKRIPYGKALSTLIKKIPSDRDYVIVGDLNSNYNEYRTFKKSQKFNDTKGITAINHFLQTIDNDRMNSFSYFKKSSKKLHYNLWMELEYKYRWSYLYRGRNNSLDHIIIPQSLTDGLGVEYLKSSFQRFMPEYLVKKRKIFRWKFSKRGGIKHHIGKGYSDHIPIIAKFSY